MTDYQTIMGVPILTNKYMPVCEPKMQLSKDVSVSYNFRSEFNAWLKEYFGEAPVIYQIDTSILYGKVAEEVSNTLGVQTKAFVTHPMNVHCFQEAVEKVNALT